MVFYSVWWHPCGEDASIHKHNPLKYIGMMVSASQPFANLSLLFLTKMTPGGGIGRVVTSF
jgi:hypothetical protein